MRERTSLETAKELLRRVDDRMGVFLREALAGVEPSPRDGDRRYARSLRRLDIERGVSDVGRFPRVGAGALERGEDRLGVRLVPLGVFGADHDVEVLLEVGQRVEG